MKHIWDVEELAIDCSLSFEEMESTEILGAKPPEFTLPA